MKKTQSMLALLLVFVLLFTACGAKSESAAQDNSAAKDYYEDAKEETVEEEMATEGSFSTTTQVTADEMTVEEVKTYAEKIIYSGHVYMQTTEFDSAIVALDQAVEEFGGFVQDSSVNGSVRHYSDGTTGIEDRWAYYTVRIPTDRFEAFMSLADGLGNVTSSSRTAENVTSQYTDYEARLDSLYTQEERLLDMLKESGDLESLIALEARLAEVRYEIESIERNLRNLDQRLAYSTVDLEIQEVEVYTRNVAVQRTFGEKLADAFADGWNGFIRGLQNFIINLAEGLPVLVLLAVIAVAIVLAIRKLRRMRAARVHASEPKKEAEVPEDKAE